MACMLTNRPCYPRDRSQPRFDFLRVFAKFKRSLLFQRFGIDATAITLISRSRKPYLFIDSHRKHKTFVIIRVFANQVDSPRRTGDYLRFLSEMLFK